MTIPKCNQLLDWIEQGYELSEADLKAWLRDLLYEHKRLVRQVSEKEEVKA